MEDAVLQATRERIVHEVQAIHLRLIEISHLIHDNPELGSQEHRAVGRLTEEPASGSSSAGIPRSGARRRRQDGQDRQDSRPSSCPCCPPCLVSHASSPAAEDGAIRSVHMPIDLGLQSRHLLRGVGGEREAEGRVDALDLRHQPFQLA